MSLKSNNKPKTRFCQTCGVPVFVHKNSGLKRCKACVKVHNNAQYRDWYSKQERTCRKLANEKQKLKMKEDPQYRLLINSKKSAKERGLEHSIDVIDIVIPDKCPVLNCEMIHKTAYAPTLDRIDSSKGYIKGNVQVISWKANTMKNDATYEELLLFADWVKYHLVDVVTEPKVMEVK